MPAVVLSPLIAFLPGPIAQTTARSYDFRFQGFLRPLDDRWPARLVLAISRYHVQSAFTMPLRRRYLREEQTTTANGNDGTISNLIKLPFIELGVLSEFRAGWHRLSSRVFRLVDDRIELVVVFFVLFVHPIRESL